MLALAALSLIATPLAAPVAARGPDPESRAAVAVGPERLVSAFASICMAHLGDTAAQIAAATTAPWQFTRRDTTTYNIGTLQFDTEWNGQPVCSMTSDLTGSNDLFSVSEVARDRLSLGEGEPYEDMRMWRVQPEGSDQSFVIGLLVSDHSGRTIATLLVQRAGAQ